MCQKKLYARRHDAQEAALDNSMLYNTRPMIAYKCTVCPGHSWHLTTQKNPLRKLPPKIPEEDEGPHRPLINDWYRCNVKRIRKQNRRNGLLKRF